MGVTIIARMEGMNKNPVNPVILLKKPRHRTRHAKQFPPPWWGRTKEGVNPLPPGEREL